MAENIIMPQLGESIAEGTIVKWLKEVGQSVKKDENILLISTDKVEAEIPSPCDGVLTQIGAKEGQTVPVGTVLGQVGAQGEATSSQKEEIESNEDSPSVAAANNKNIQEVLQEQSSPIMQEQEQPSINTTKAQSSYRSSENSLKNFISPLVRKIAAENNISENTVNNIAGTGRDGRVSKNDILKYISSGAMQSESISAQTTQNIAKPYVPSFSEGRDEIKPLSTMRKVIMENMVRSKATSAHVTTFFEIDYSKIDDIRKRHKESFKKQEGVSLTYTTFLALAVCQTLKRHPFINAQIKENEVVFKKDIHLGVAVAIEEPEPGLMVPVIKNADKQNLRGLAHAIGDLSFRVRNRKIKPDELSGGSFTITNPGNYGAVIGTPIINQPQVAILGVGNIKKQVCVEELNGKDVITIKNLGWLSLSFDHRLVDGATADIFMADLKKTLENFTDEVI